MTRDFTEPFSAWAGPRKPKILVIGEAFGSNEDLLKQPFVGESGKLLFELLGLSGELERELHESICKSFRYDLAWVKQRTPWLEACGVAFTNVFNLRPAGNKIEILGVEKKNGHIGIASALGPMSRGKYLPSCLCSQLERLKSEIAESQPNIIVAAGATPSWGLLGQVMISKVRGALANGIIGGVGPGCKVLPVYHPAFVIRRWEWKSILLADLIKAWRESDSPTITRLNREITHTPSIEEVEQWVSATLASPPRVLSADVETSKRAITQIGFARSPTEALSIPFRLADHTINYWANASDELRAWNAAEALLSSGIPLLFQNGMYDLQYMIRMGLRVARPLHDTMLLHHSLYPEMQKDLGFLGSLYGNEAAWKPMGRRKITEGDGEKRDD